MKIYIDKEGGSWYDITKNKDGGIDVNFWNYKHARNTINFKSIKLFTDFIADCQAIRHKSIDD